MKKFKKFLAAALVCTAAVFPCAHAASAAAQSLVQQYHDVPAGAWYFNDVAAILEQGMMKGKSSTRFDPGGILTNAEVAQILYNCGVRKAEGGEFIDLSSGAWYSGAVMECGEYFPVHWNRYEGGAEFRPSAPITREELCYTLLRADGMSDDAILAEYEAWHGDFYGGWRNYPEAALQVMADRGIISGYGNGSYGGADSLTRAQCAAILNRFLELH